MMIETVSVADAVANELRRRLLAGEYPGGKELRDTELTEEFGAARPTIRAAVQMLVAAGLLKLHLGPCSTPCAQARSAPPWRRGKHTSVPLNDSFSTSSRSAACEIHRLPSTELRLLRHPHQLGGRHRRGAQPLGDKPRTYPQRRAAPDRILHP